MSDTNPLLFYSDKCVYCAQLLAKLKEKNITNIKLICVDKVRVPDIITQVPTLAVKSMNKPLVGKHVFDWVESQTFFNIPTNNIQKKTINPRLQTDESLSFIRLGKSNTFTTLKDDEHDPPTVHNTVDSGYNFGVLKSYKDNNNK